jgi:hypothetical protein
MMDMHTVYMQFVHRDVAKADTLGGCRHVLTNI